MQLMDINPRVYDLVVGMDVDSRSLAITELDQQFKGRYFKMPSDPLRSALTIPRSTEFHCS